MKRCFIIHGWGGNPQEGWLPWLNQELTKRGFKVENPAMPDTDTPVIEAWVKKLSAVVKKPDKDTFLVGHSIGCQTIIRYLQTIGAPIGGIVLVAPWFTLKGLTAEEKPIGKPWVDTPMDYDKIKHAANHIITIFSANDPVVPLSNVALFEKRFGAKVIMEKNKEHFSGSEGINELPSALNAVLSLVK
jgi:predicted alpha/beta hydrolase family esterase